MAQDVLQQVKGAYWKEEGDKGGEYKGEGTR